ncbi:MAG: PilZ domain-containing protein [Myxococcota bacterium]
MLEAVDLIPARRRAPRHACTIEVPMICDLWDEPVALETRDISRDGFFFKTQLPLEPGTEVVLEIHAGGEHHFVLGSVRRSDLSGRSAGMGIELLDAEPSLLESLDSLVVHRPPALPRSAPPIVQEFLWVDALLTYEEDLGDRVNIFEVSELIAMETDGIERAIDDAAPVAALLSA